MARAEVGAGSRSTPLWQRVPTWLALGLLALSLFLLTLPGDLRNNADTVDRFFVTRSLLENHSTEVQCGGSPPADNVRIVPGRHGCYYAIYGPGQTILMAPLYAIGRGLAALTETGSSGAQAAQQELDEAVFARMLDPILGALAIIVFFLLAIEVGYSRRTAILLTIAVAFASSVFPDVQSGQEQIQSTLAILMLVYACLRSISATRQTSRNWWLFVAGAAAGFGIWTRYDFSVVILVVAAVMAVWAWRQIKPQRILVQVRSLWPATVGLLPFLIFDALWNMVRFGAPWREGQSISGQFGTSIWQGVPNLLISPGKGLIWYVPLLWLVPFAWRRFHRRTPLVGWMTFGLLLAFLAFYGVIKYWNGDPAWGPRYLFPIVPLLLLPLGELIERFSRLRLSARSIILGVALLSLCVQFLAVSVDPWRFWYHLIEVRTSQHTEFTWNPKLYGYYWTTNPGLMPIIYQAGAAVDVVRIGLDHRVGLPEETPAEGKACQLVSKSDVAKVDRCDLYGLTLRPLNTISPIWLNDRYQFIDAGEFPLQLVWRVVILAVLSLIALASALILHLQFWRDPQRRDIASRGESHLA